MLSAQEKLEVAVRALEDVMRKDGMGADMSPPGPCYDIASRALRQIKSTVRNNLRKGNPNVF